MSRRVVPGLPVMMVLGNELRRAARVARSQPPAPAQAADTAPGPAEPAVTRA